MLKILMFSSAKAANHCDLLQHACVYARAAHGEGAIMHAAPACLPVLVFFSHISPYRDREKILAQKNLIKILQRW